MDRLNAPKSVGLAEVARQDAQVLILGSLPGRISLERGEYYANPRNAFWGIMESLLDVSRELPYAVRLERLKERGIALWDVCQSACRPGSLDSQISGIVTNDFNVFFSHHPQVRLICFNGGKACQVYDRKVLPGLACNFAGIRHQQLPSTAPTHAAMPFKEKLRRWGEVVVAGRQNCAGLPPNLDFRVSNFAES